MVNMTSGAQAATSHAAPGEGLSRNAKKRRAAKEKLAAEKAKNDKWQSEAKPGWNGASPGAGPSGGGGGGTAHPRRWGWWARSLILFPNCSLAHCIGS